MSEPKKNELPDAGWASSFPEFTNAEASAVVDALREFVRDPGEAQVRAWKDTVPKLQREVREVQAQEVRAASYSALLEYQLPLESRRADSVMLVDGGVLVIELKGKQEPSAADLDQVAAYARDLHAYHRHCQDRPVTPVLVPTRFDGPTKKIGEVWLTSPANLDVLIRELGADDGMPVTPLDDFCSDDVYSPLPTLIQASRELFFSGSLRDVWRARAATEPAVEAMSAIAHEAASTKTRHLVLITGVPGSGKTLVGMRSVHAHYLDDLAVPRAGGGQAAPALFLSGNGPLVEVLQHVLRNAGGGGRTFVRHIKDYLDSHIPRASRVPGEHLLVFDEAQRAFTPDKVRELHPKWSGELVASEPELFVRLCDRMPDWSVLVGLVGSGQEIHVGEEGGLAQWRAAIEKSPEASRWVVHAPARLEEIFQGSGLSTRWDMRLNLDTELRYHTASRWHELVAQVLETPVADSLPLVRDSGGGRYGDGLDGMRIWLTRDLESAKAYLRERYENDPDARFGLLASSRDKLLADYGVPNTWADTRALRLGPWFAEGEDHPESCRRLEKCATEFGAQGLELDMALVAWGSDLRRERGAWDSSAARKYRNGDVKVLNPHQLRLNAYRVLLTRGRDGNVIFVPPNRALDDTWAFLREVGFKELP